MVNRGTYLTRIIEAELNELSEQLPAIAIEGAKGVGKTETARRRAKTVFRLDDAHDRALLEVAPDRSLAAAPPVLIDEWQRMPEAWDMVRRAVDDGADAAAFLLTGSASPLAPTHHSGAGRIVSVRMRPLSLAERLPGVASVSFARLISGTHAEIDGETSIDAEDYVEEILRSGFPGMRDQTGRALEAQLSAYAELIVDRDIPELGPAVRRAPALKRWLTAYASACSTTTSWEKIRTASEGKAGEVPSRGAADSYRNVLEHIWIAESVPAWLPSASKLARLNVSAKQQLVDPAIAATLLGETADTLLGSSTASGASSSHRGAYVGAFFESLVTQAIRVYAQAAEARVYHLRTQRGEREVDLIVERYGGEVVAIEIKFARAVNDADVRHLNWLKNEIGERLVERIIITSGKYAYRRKDGVAVVPAALLGA